MWFSSFGNQSFGLNQVLSIFLYLFYIQFAKQNCNKKKRERVFQIFNTKEREEKKSKKITKEKNQKLQFLLILLDNCL